MNEQKLTPTMGRCPFTNSTLHFIKIKGVGGRWYCIDCDFLFNHDDLDLLERAPKVRRQLLKALRKLTPRRVHI